MRCGYRSSRGRIVVATVIATIISSLLSLSSVRAGLSKSAIMYEKLAIIVGMVLLAGTLAPILPNADAQVPPQCNGLTATIFVSGGIIVGGPNAGATYAGTLNGGSGSDVIVGTNGDDTINALGGNDIICGNNGTDTMYGGEGNDTINGNQGIDTLNGGAGNDTINGDQGDDNIFGGLGNDTIDGGMGFNTCTNGETVTNCELIPAAAGGAVASTGTGAATFSIGDGSFSSPPSAIEPVTLPSPPSGVTFPHGLFAFTLSLPPGVSEVTVTITFPSTPGIQYWKFQNGAFFPMPAGSVVISGNQVDLTLTDGGPGDADGQANGVIVDPGGPVALGTGGSCDGRVIVTNDPSLRAQCVIVDLDAPKITKTLLTVNDFFCVEGTDDTGIARVTVNGEEVPPWQGTSGSFCAKGIVKAGQTISISATDLAGNKAGAVVLASTEATQTSQAFASFVDTKYNPHVGIEAIVIQNLSQEQLKQVRLMLSPDMDRGRFLLSDYAFKQIDKAEKVTVVMNAKYNNKDLQGYLILAASNSGILAVFPIDVKPSDFHIRSATTHQKHPTMYLDTIDTEKLIPSRTLNSWQRSEFDEALQAIVEGRSLTLTQQRVLQYATLPDHLKIWHKSHQYEVWVNDGEQAITSLQGSITIKNTSDTPMNNVRINVELASRILMFEERVIKNIPVGDEVTVNFKAMKPDMKILEHDYLGKVTIAPSNHTPVQIPIALSSIPE